MTTETLTIDGMSCDHCVRAVREALTTLDGVEVDDVRIGMAQVTMADSVAHEAIAEALAAEGYTLAAETP